MNYRLYLSAIFCCMLSANFSTAQTWQWGKQGGDVTDGTSAVPFETVWDMATDPNGNLYVLSLIEGSNSPKVDGISISPYNDKDILLSSFTCEGVYRWKKHMGGWGNDHYNYAKHALKLDDSGRVYVCGRITPPTGAQPASRFDVDSVLPTSVKKWSFLVQYDTAGNFQWLRMPQSDTSVAPRCVVYDMDLDSSGEVHMLAYLEPGKLADGNIVITNNGFYVMHYTAQGALVSVTQLQIQASPYSGVQLRMTRNKVNGNFYLSGQWTFGTDPITINGTAITSLGFFLAVFNSAGGSLWVKNSDQSMDINNRPIIDMLGNIYIAGTALGNSTIYNTHVVTNTFGNYFVPFAMKLGPTGNVIWAKNAMASSHAFASDIALYNNRVYLTGLYADVMSFSGYPKTLNHAPGQNYDVFLMSLNPKTGAVISLDTLGSAFGAEESSHSLAFDKRNNIYVGGYIHNDLTVGSSVLTKYGGYSDFFVAKYGYNNCNCTTPTAAYGFSMDGARSGTFSYSGTPSYDSVTWDFGDGGYSNLPNPVHAFASDGSYLVCATVYTGCGSSTLCKNVLVTDVKDALTSAVAVYPNPVTDQLIVEGIERATTLSLQDVYGRQIFQTKTADTKTIVPVSSIAPGVYLLNMISPDGRKQVQKIVKE